MIKLHHILRGKNQLQASFSSLSMNEFCLYLVGFYEIELVPTNLRHIDYVYTKQT